MKMKKIAIAAAALALTVSYAVPMSIHAAGTTYTPGLTAATSDGTTKVTQSTVSFDKFLVMKKDASVPNAAISFQITPYDSVASEGTVIKKASGSSLAVLNGVTALTSGSLNFVIDQAKTGSTTAGVAQFKPGDPTVTDDDAAADPDVVWQDATAGNEKYAAKIMTLDFSDVQFKEPGVYRYLITEVADNQGITNDVGVGTAGDGNNTFRTLDVYVEDYAGYLAALEAAGTDITGYTAVSGNELLITGFVLYAGKYDAAPDRSGGDLSAYKSNSYTNAFASQNLTFGKIVTGNQGSKDKYFKYTVEISNIKQLDTVLIADVTTAADTAVPASPNAATNSDFAGKDNPDQLEVKKTKTLAADGYVVEDFDNDGDGTNDSYKITAEYYLQNNQYITIKGLPKDAKYSVTEDAEDYTSTAADAILDETDSSVKGFKINTIDFKSASSGTIANDDIYTGFRNERSGILPTGLLSTVGSSAGIAALGAVGVIGGLLYLKKKKSEED